jgi:hypothetical protein
LSSPIGFYPAYSLITAITQGALTIVDFGVTHDFTPGQIVSFRVPKQYGMVELNNQETTVMTISQTMIMVGIDSRNYTPFIYPVALPQALAMVVPSASGILPGSKPPTMTLFDSYDNIPPE